MSSGEDLKEIAVQIVDGYGHATIGKPYLFGVRALTAISRYKVSLFYRDKEICTPNFSVWWYDREGADAKKADGKGGTGKTQRERNDNWENIKGYGGSTALEKKKVYYNLLLIVDC